MTPLPADSDISNRKQKVVLTPSSIKPWIRCSCVAERSRNLGSQPVSGSYRTAVHPNPAQVSLDVHSVSARAFLTSGLARENV